MIGFRKHLRIAFAVFIAGLLFAACEVETGDPPTEPPASPTEAIPTATSTTTPTSTPSAPTPTPTPQYDRDEWGGWIDADGDCLNTRAEVLMEESLVQPVLQGCRVVSGLWIDPWTGNEFTDPADVEIDHHVPVYNAHRSGGSGWSSGQRRTFYNDVENLNALSGEVNRDKSAWTPDRWRPPDGSTHCAYAVQWQYVKEKYGLSFAAGERRTLDAMLATCDPDTSQAAYRTCEEAEAAGEQRVLGSKGDGLGFPRRMVPSARDGDEDGVVCEVDPSYTPDPNPTAAAAPTSAPDSGQRIYGSCDEAQAAGEIRVKGSKGEGRGFPAEMVPDARDGDRDGVVCER